MREILDTLFEAWMSHDALRSAACFAPEGVYREAEGREVRGREQIAAHFAQFFRSGPPWTFAVEETIFEGERAAVTFSFSVKGDGPQWRERAGCALVKFNGGLIELWREYHG